MDTIVKNIEATAEQVLMAKTFGEALPSLACAACTSRKLAVSPFSRYFNHVDLVAASPEAARSLVVQYVDVLTLVCDQCGHLMFFSKHRVEAVVKRRLEATNNTQEEPK